MTVPPTFSPRNGFGVAALCLGIFGLLFALVPLPPTVLLGWLFAVAGTVLGVVGFVYARRRVATNLKTALVGAILSFLALPVGVLTASAAVAREDVAGSTASAAAPERSTYDQQVRESQDRLLDKINQDLERRRAAVSQAPVSEPAASGPLTTVTGGTYEVGTDMVAGRYKTTGPDGSSYRSSCYIERSKDDSGETDSILSNDIIEGPSSVTVEAGEFAKFSGPCTWTMQ